MVLDSGLLFWATQYMHCFRSQVLCEGKP